MDGTGTERVFMRISKDCFKRQLIDFRSKVFLIVVAFFLSFFLRSVFIFS